MTLKTPERLLEIADNFAAGYSYTACAKLSGVSPRTLFQWLRDSAAGTDPDLVVEYMGEEMQFAQVMALSRKILHHHARSAVETRAAFGHDEPIFFQGRPSWVEDERCVGIDDPDLREMLGYARDGYLRDAAGNRVQHVLHHQPPIAAVLRLMEVSWPEEWTPASTINMINADTGVQRAAPITGEKVAIPLKPTRPAISAPARFAEPPEDATFEDILGPEPEPDVVATVATDTDPDAPPVAPGIQPDDRVVEPVSYSTPTPPAYQSEPNPLLSPRTGRPRSALEMSLLAELDKSLAKKGTQ